MENYDSDIRFGLTLHSPSPPHPADTPLFGNSGADESAISEPAHPHGFTAAPFAFFDGDASALPLPLSLPPPPALQGGDSTIIDLTDALDAGDPADDTCLVLESKWLPLPASVAAAAATGQLRKRKLEDPQDPPDARGKLRLSGRATSTATGSGDDLDEDDIVFVSSKPSTTPALARPLSSSPPPPPSLSLIPANALGYPHSVALPALRELVDMTCQIVAMYYLSILAVKLMSLPTSASAISLNAKVMELRQGTLAKISTQSDPSHVLNFLANLLPIFLQQDVQVDEICQKLHAPSTRSQETIDTAVRNWIVHATTQYYEEKRRLDVLRLMAWLDTHVPQGTLLGLSRIHRWQLAYQQEHALRRSQLAYNLSTSDELRLRSLQRQSSLAAVPRGHSQLAGLMPSPRQAYAGFESQAGSSAQDVFKSLTEEGFDFSSMAQADPPPGVRASLLKHQRQGLHWMKTRESSVDFYNFVTSDAEGASPHHVSLAPKGGILGDDMGLGKTLQVISLILANPPTAEDRKATLIVCPVSVINNWEEQIKTHVDAGLLKVVVYHSADRSGLSAQLQEANVVITTYTIVGQESDNPQSLLQSVKWLRIVLDEAHTIRNYKSRQARGCFGLDAEHRWCLTGTPVHNTINDLFSLAVFFRMLSVKELSIWTTNFGRIKPSGSDSGRLVGDEEWKSQSRAQAVNRLRALLNLICLRRVKSLKMDGKPIVSLPDKFVKLEYVEFSKEEAEIYKKLEIASKAAVQKYKATNSVLKNYIHIFVMILRLRQLCDYPDLVKPEDLNAVSDSKTDAVLNLLRAITADDNQVDCMKCAESARNPTVTPCCHVFCNECILQHMVAKKACPACNLRIKETQLIVAKDFSMQQVAAEGGDGQADQTRPHDDEMEDDEDVILLEDENECSSTTSTATATGAATQDVGGEIYMFDPADALPDDAQSVPESGESSGTLSLPSAVPRSTVLGAGQGSSEPKQVSFVNRGAKLRKIIEILETTRQINPQVKTVVFSQWTSMLDLIQRACCEHSISVTRLDGSMSRKQRDHAVNSFQHDPSISVFLSSLKCGSLGLTLTAATQVVIFDPWWCPSAEDQAVDRVYRLGQKNPVYVWKLLVKGTIEESILEAQMFKRSLMRDAFRTDAESHGDRDGMMRLIAKM